MPYEVEITNAATRDIKKLVTEKQAQVRTCIDALASDPRNASVSKLTDQDAYRSRTGNFRVIFQILDVALRVIVLRVLDRKNAYK